MSDGTVSAENASPVNPNIAPDPGMRLTTRIMRGQFPLEAAADWAQFLKEKSTWLYFAATLGVIGAVFYANLAEMKSDAVIWKVLAYVYITPDNITDGKIFLDTIHTSDFISVVCFGIMIRLRRMNPVLWHALIRLYANLIRLLVLTYRLGLYTLDEFEENYNKLKDTHGKDGALKDLVFPEVTIPPTNGQGLLTTLPPKWSPVKGDTGYGLYTYDQFVEMVSWHHEQQGKYVGKMWRSQIWFWVLLGLIVMVASFAGLIHLSLFVLIANDLDKDLNRVMTGMRLAELKRHHRDAEEALGDLLVSLDVHREEFIADEGKLIAAKWLFVGIVGKEYMGFADISRTGTIFHSDTELADLRSQLPSRTSVPAPVAVAPVSAA